MTIEIGRLASWRRGPGKVWFIWGRFDILMDSLDGGGPVRVKSRSGGIDEIHIERVTRPNREGFAYAWPVGTASEPGEVVQLPTANPDGQASQAMRNRARARSNFRRMRSGRHR